MPQPDRTFICINCGNEINELYKRYSSTVLKLTSCNKCKNLADKYIEYDPIIIIIDLVLLSRAAYRHVLYNTHFSIHWKLIIIIQLMEAYSEWTINSRSVERDFFGGKKPIVLDNFFTGDLIFYKTIVKVILRTMVFYGIFFILTMVYNKVYCKRKSVKETFLQIWKSLILSSFGIFLLIPSLIWDLNVKDHHYMLSSLYTTLSQLVAYTVICNCSKWWSVAVIIVAYFWKVVCFDQLNTVIITLK